MPNHIINILYIEKGTVEEVLKIKQAIAGKDDEGAMAIDFNKIIAMPEYLHKTISPMSNTTTDLIVDYDKLEDKSPEKIKQFIRKHFPIEDLIGSTNEEKQQEFNALRGYIETGCTNWYDWAIQNWGTKWNAYNTIDNCYSSIQFDTVWSTPAPVMLLLSEMFPEQVFRIEYADENIGQNCGSYSYQGGELLDPIDSFETQEETCEFACNVQGYDYEEYTADQRAYEEEVAAEAAAESGELGVA
jgi:hypothetical protein